MWCATRDLAHYVYLLRDKVTGVYKIGVTQYIHSRPAEYRFFGHQMETIMYVRLTPLHNNDYCKRYCRDKAFKLETFLCKKFLDKSVTRREWFVLTESDIDEIISLVEYLVDVTQDNDYMSVKLVSPAIISDTLR